MFRGLTAILVACCLLVGVAGPVSAHRSETVAATALVDVHGVADHELVDALERAGLLNEWVDAGNVSASAALLSVDGSDQYVASRDELIAQLQIVSARRSHVTAREGRLDRAAENIAVLDQLARDLRRQLSDADRSTAVALSVRMTYEARRTLLGVRNDPPNVALNPDRVDLVEHRIAQIRAQLQREIDVLGRSASLAKNLEAAAISALSRAVVELEFANDLVLSARQAGIHSQIRVAADAVVAVGQMGDLHQLRSLATTSVGGLSVVTVDAYVRGAEAIQSDCTIEWPLLAGIGRVESRHGTIGDTLVQASGKLTEPILGPLLDGGATAAEARAKARRDEEEAAALAAEEAALAEAEAKELDGAVWGDEAVERVARLERERVEAAEEHVFDQFVTEPEPDDGPPPRFDPLLWGDELPFSEEDADAELSDSEESDGESDEGEDDAPRGNGFAVIRDSDNGRLDGNARWDRAVGPMQFIPETWSNWETDGNGDGVLDPQNLYDAAATAGQFLCHLKQTRGPSPHSFVLGYNSSSTYVRNVVAVAEAFEAVSLPSITSP